MPAPSGATAPINGWTKTKERRLLEWQQQARVREVCHMRAYEMYIRRNNKILLPSIVLSASAVFFDSAAIALDEQRTAFIITAALLTAIASVLTGILQATKPSEIAGNHKEMSKGYSKVILQTEAMLSKSYSERPSGQTFLEQIEAEMLSLKTGGFDIPSSIWVMVRKEYGLALPKLNGGITGSNLSIDVPPAREQSAPASAPTPAAPAALAPIATVVDIGAPSTSPSTSPLPLSELRIANDPAAVKLEKILFDFQMSRLG